METNATSSLVLTTTNPPGTRRQELSDNEIQSSMAPPRFKVHVHGSEDSPTGHPNELAMVVSTSDELSTPTHIQDSTFDVNQFRARWQSANRRAPGCKKFHLNFCTPKQQDQFLSCLHDLVPEDTKTVVIKMGRKYEWLEWQVNPGMDERGHLPMPPLRDSLKFDTARLSEIIGGLEEVTSLDFCGQALYETLCDEGTVRLSARTFMRANQLPLDDLQPLCQGLQALHLSYLCLDMNGLLEFLKSVNGPKLRELSLEFLEHKESDKDAQRLFQECWTSKFLHFVWNHQACADMESVNFAAGRGTFGTLTPYCHPKATRLEEKLANTAHHLTKLQLRPIPNDETQPKRDQQSPQNLEPRPLGEVWHDISCMQLGNNWRIRQSVAPFVRWSLAFALLSKRAGEFGVIIKDKRAMEKLDELDRKLAKKESDITQQPAKKKKGDDILPKSE